MTFESRWKTSLYWATLLTLTGIGVVRIVLTYPFFFQTADEPSHIACGMWWMEGAFPSWSTCSQHPPLARIAAVVPLHLDGVRAAPPPSSYSDVAGTAVLQSRGTYQRNLALARSGILPFFIVASVVVWAWTCRLFGRLPALAAVFLLQGLPPVLAHAGLATTDMALAAFLPVALYSFVLWLEIPSLKRSALLGTAFGLAVLAKLSAVVFLPLGAFLISGLRIAEERHAGIWSWSSVRRRLGLLGLATLLAFAVIWAGYRFSSAPLTKATDRPHRIGRLLGVDHFPPQLRESFFRIVEMPIPAGHFVRSIEAVQSHNARGHPSYFMGEFRRTGWWYFFPTLIAFKSPLSFLILLLVGCAYLCLGKTDIPPWKRFAPLLGAGAILLVSMFSRLNIGLRHVLPVYPLFAIVAGFGLMSLVSASRWRIGSRLVAVGLATWFVVASVRAHPDYLTYFNELSGPKPEEIEVDSDLGWGQDTKHLLAKIREMAVTQLWYRCLGCELFEDARLALALEFPRELRKLKPYEGVSGWVAIDEWALRVEGETLRREGESKRAFDWLEGFSFVRIGKSVRLYYVPPSAVRIVGEESFDPGGHRAASNARVQGSGFPARSTAGFASKGPASALDPQVFRTKARAPESRGGR